MRAKHYSLSSKAASAPQMLHLIAVLLSESPCTALTQRCTASPSFLRSPPSRSLPCEILRQLQLAPHIRIFHCNLIVFLKNLHLKDEAIACRSRRFILSQWQCLDQQ
jgi:hypothetical protein